MVALCISLFIIKRPFNLANAFWPFHFIKLLAPCFALFLLAGLKDFNPLASQPLLSYENHKGTHNHPNHAECIRLLNVSLRKCGLNENLYSGHSFRRVGCTYAFSTGISPLLVKLRGDWCSNAFEHYVKLSDDQQASTVFFKLEMLITIDQCSPNCVHVFNYCVKNLKIISYSCYELIV